YESVSGERIQIDIGSYQKDKSDNNSANSTKSFKSRLTFYPFAYALHNSELCDHCWRCTGCSCGMFCDEKCQSLGWKDHRIECRALKKSCGIPDIETRLLGRIIIRYEAIKLGKDKKDQNFYVDRTSQRSIMEICAHTDQMRKDYTAMKKFNRIFNKVIDFYGARNIPDEDEVFELHCRNFINRHAISDEAFLREIGKGLYLDLCAYNHSCRPNSIYTCKGFVATLRSLDLSTNLLDRSSTFYTYIDLLNTTQERRRLLKDTWYFNCECSRCTDENEGLLSSMLCPNCEKPKPLQIFGKVPYKDQITLIITCPECHEQVPREKIIEAVETMRFINGIIENNEIEQIASNQRLSFLTELRNRSGKVLPNINIYYCKIIQFMIPLVNPSNYKLLLELHLDSEACIRFCYPANHPTLALHLRNIAIFYLRNGSPHRAKHYFECAREILHFTLDVNHSMSIANQVLLNEAIESSLQGILQSRNCNIGDTKVCDVQLVPEGTKDIENISNLSFIRMFISDKLSFPDESREFGFGFEDLTDIGPIGEGAYGHVNKMRHNGTGRLMAVKKVRIISGKCDDGETNRSLQRLRLEIDAINRASDCPQIVRFYGLTFHEGDCLVCMELMDISLEKLYHTVHNLFGVFDERILGHVAVSVLKALNHLKNEIQIIHRDVKPSNILLDLKGAIKLCDFGISGYLVNSVAQTREAGCRPYMAPERLLTSAAYDIRSDVWSLGITLEEVALGRFPYPRFNENELFVQLEQVVYGDAPIMGPSDTYSIMTVKFINSCLIKETDLRPNYKKLMDTEFFKFYDNLEGTSVYVASYVQTALTQLQLNVDSLSDCFADHIV
ncbi:unnamed protein product, partial [Dracunculus medinensis]|uniref:mitogen-activated protein kinase kinase n=1 Tax=Dracunculus medinensis TaxID=318479 RepID=A0A158Q413_DRAME